MKHQVGLQQELADLRRRLAELQTELQAQSIYRSFFDGAGLGMMVIDPADCRLVETNPELHRMLGYAAAELQGKYLADIIDPAADAGPDSPEGRIARQSIPCQLEQQFFHKNGRSIWVRLFLSPIAHPLTASPLIIGLVEEITERKRLEQSISRALLQAEAARLQAEELAAVDPLTGLLNRRGLMERLRAELGRARRDGKPLSLILIDLDHFKRINDTFGHQAGDMALRRFADCLIAKCRAIDLLARTGGDEFIICLPGAGVQQARTIAERLRFAAEGLILVLPDAVHRFEVTASFGVASFAPKKNDNLERLISRADQAMYLAKREGRNRVRFLDISAPPPQKTIAR